MTTTLKHPLRYTTLLLMLGIGLLWQTALTRDTHGQHDHAPSDDAPHTEEADACRSDDAEAHDTHAEHEDADAHEDEHEGQDANEDAHEDHDAHAGHDDHGVEENDGDGLRLTPEQRVRFGIVVETAGPGTLHNEVTLAGEITFNQDHQVHLVPPVSGVVRRVHKSVGDSVKTGDVLAVIDSTELAAAKLDYIAAQTEVGCCQFELPRAQAIHDHTTDLLSLLETEPSIDTLRNALSGEMGHYGTELVSTYVAYTQAQQTYERERILKAKALSSEADFLAAEGDFKRAEAAYIGTRDAVAYDVRQNLLETKRDRQLDELRARTAAQMLRVLGLSEAEITALSQADAATPAATPATASAAPHACTDPNCTDCGDHAPPAAPAATDASRLGWHAIKAPMDGMIVQRHLAHGERVDPGSEVFTLADLHSVWVDLTVYTRDLDAVHTGDEIALRVDHSGAETHGTIAMVTPFVEAATRAATARVVLDNEDGRWMPGTFVTGFLRASDASHPIVVPRHAVQTVEGRQVIFVEADETFTVQPVVLGPADRTHVAIRAGLAPGSTYVTQGAFQLKATMVTRRLDAHAGHGH